MNYDTLPLSTCFDTIEDSNSDDQARAWIRKALDAKIDLARFVANRRGKGPATEVVGFLKGAFNLAFRIRFDDDGPDAIIRFPKPGHIATAFLEEKLVNEVQAIEYIRQNTTIPVPFIHAWGFANESPRQLGPFIIMDFIEGTLASRILQKPTDDDQQELILNPDLDSVVLDKFYRQVAGCLLQLSRLEFKRIGAISREPDDDRWTSSKRPLTYNMNELATSAGYPTDEFPAASFGHASDFFKHVAHVHLTHLYTQRNLAASSEVASARYIARHRYLQLIDHYCSAEDDGGPFLPFCDDFRPANILVDPVTLEITAVLDWEFTNAMPAQFSYDPPWWLLLADPGSWVDRHAVEEFRDLYEPRMAQFLAALEAVEAEEGRGSHDQRLSVRMRRSWETGRFWFNFASRKSYDVDTIYWRVLHGGGEATELLDSEVLSEMESAVEKKMIQLREYREECAIHPRLNVPVRAILIQAVFNLLFGLIYLGPEVAFNAYIASCTLFLNLSYAAPVAILLIRGRSFVTDNSPEFTFGKGIFGYVVNWISVLFVAVTSVFFCFPPAIPVNVSTMNYVVAVLDIFAVFLVALWLNKRKSYNGPKFDLILGQDLPVTSAEIDAEGCGGSTTGKSAGSVAKLDQDAA